MHCNVKYTQQYLKAEYKLCLLSLLDILCFPLEIKNTNTFREREITHKLSHLVFDSIYTSHFSKSLFRFLKTK